MNNVIIGSVITATTVTYIKQILEKEPLTVKPLFGGFFVGIGLFAIGSVSPETAKGLAVLILVTSVVLNGAPLFTAANKLVK